MGVLAASHDASAGHLEGSVQIDDPVPFVVVRSALHLTRPKRQHRLGVLQSLNLRLLVHADDDGVLDRVKVEAHDVLHLFRKPSTLLTLNVR